MLPQVRITKICLSWKKPIGTCLPGYSITFAYVQPASITLLQQVILENINRLALATWSIASEMSAQLVTRQDMPN